ncbi:MULTISPECIES: hypothetical protein [Desulfitobacterium]|uniref:Uncharacterized protein n=1 Tax=Desulfitobacterium chlororespirans DSM 11544 TaxID=1121395 RepID=A0A1M7UTW0_9FIRM|nr:MULTISPECIES: hypothetical protein [Desulfitobacterium]SHN86471.1 hypothetical protein SAMN02745215_04640 [Desulfitobacterium chlororespirans DSM 11544]
MNSRKDAVEIQIQGIKCDNRTCGFKDDTVRFEEYGQWLNKPCPKCGANLLTEEDYASTLMLVELTGIVNDMLPEPPDDEERVKFEAVFNGTGKIAFRLKE